MSILIFGSCRMRSYYQCIVLIIILCLQKSCAQVLLFGNCSNVATMEYFELERFLGKWYTIERYPIWYEEYGQCAYKVIQQCGRTIAFQHSFVKSGIEYVVYFNSTYAPGDEAVFRIPESNIDPYGIPLSIINTDYMSYAIVYGCRYNPQLDIKYVAAWILSRNSTISTELLDIAYEQLNSLPALSLAYLEKVNHEQQDCTSHWTAYVATVYYNNSDVVP